MEPKGTAKSQTTSGFFLTKKKTNKEMAKLNGGNVMQVSQSKAVLKFFFLPQQWERDENIDRIPEF